jgi:hypothetical protein
MILDQSLKLCCGLPMRSNRLHQCPYRILGSRCRGARVKASAVMLSVGRNALSSVMGAYVECGVDGALFNSVKRLALVLYECSLLVATRPWHPCCTEGR